MTATKLLEQAATLSGAEKLQAARGLIDQAQHEGAVTDAGQRQTIQRLLRRLENPDVSEDVWEGLEEAEQGNL